MAHMPSESYSTATGHHSDFYAEKFDTDNNMNSTEAGLQIEIMGIALGKVTE